MLQILGTVCGHHLNTWFNRQFWSLTSYKLIYLFINLSFHFFLSQNCKLSWILDYGLKATLKQFMNLPYVHFLAWKLSCSTQRLKYLISEPDLTTLDDSRLTFLWTFAVFVASSTWQQIHMYDLRFVFMKLGLHLTKVGGNKKLENVLLLQCNNNKFNLYCTLYLKISDLNKNRGTMKS